MPVVHLLKTKKKAKKIQMFKQTRNANYIYRDDLDKAYFQHDMVYRKYKALTKRTESVMF